jgi:RNA polymerase sigma-70 factor, ECF subfamily
MSDDFHKRQLFDQRFVASQDRLYGYIASLLPRRDDANEVFQETSLKLLQNWMKYDPARPFSPWAFTIALNEVRLFARRNRHKGGMLHDHVLTVIAEEQFRSAEKLDQSLGRLSDCLQQLSSEKRELLQECYSGERSIQSVAARRSVRPDALYKQLERLRHWLLNCMEGQRLERKAQDE